MSEAAREAHVEVTVEDAISFLEHAFRNIDLPALSPADVEDVRDGLQYRLAALAAGGAGDESRDEAHGYAAELREIAGMVAQTGNGQLRWKQHRLGAIADYLAGLLPAQPAPSTPDLEQRAREMDQAMVFLGPFLAEQGLEGQLLNGQARRVYEAAVAALQSTLSRTARLEEALRECCKRLRRCAEAGGNAPFAVDALFWQFEAALNEGAE